MKMKFKKTKSHGNYLLTHVVKLKNIEIYINK